MAEHGQSGSDDVRIRATWERDIQPTWLLHYKLVRIIVTADRCLYYYT